MSVLPAVALMLTILVWTLIRRAPTIVQEHSKVPANFMNTILKLIDVRFKMGFVVRYVSVLMGGMALIVRFLKLMCLKCETYVN